MASDAWGMRGVRLHTAIAAVSAAAALGCAHGIGKLPLQEKTVTVPCRAAVDCQPLRLTYLGSGGMLMRHGEDEILMAPFFSHASLIRTGMLSLQQASDAIDTYMPTVPNAAAILSGHAHYDHLYDVPYVMEHRAPNARLYANRTALHLLASRKDLAPRMEAVDDRSWAEGRPQRWIEIPATQVRFLAIESDHAPHVGSYRFWDGQLEEDEPELPGRASGWLLGTALTFVIEFRNPDGSVAHRVFYQDSAANPGVGAPPPGEIDVAILTAASFELVEQHPESILGRTNPRFTVMAHWEDFFQPYTQERSELRVVRGTNGRRLAQELARLLPPDRYTFPVPGGCICVGPSEECHPDGAP